MKISAKVDYACRALIELGLHWPNKTPLQIHTIGKRQGIPINFLTHILINLKQLGFVESVRGKSGGYFLVQTPAEINLKNVIMNFGGPGILFSANQTHNKGMVLDTIWQELDQHIFAKMEEITLAMICDRVRSQNKTFMFDI